EWDPVLATIDPVLKPGGRVVVSTSHPLRDHVDAPLEVPTTDRHSTETGGN
ncbi:MAG: hypothetical protein ACI8VE_003132, partial [Natrialbaceae archaeon]